MSNSQRIKHEGTYSTWKIHWLTRGGHRDGCLLRPIRVERLPRNFNVLKKLDFTSANLVAGRLMTHRSRNTSISSENYPPTPIPPFSTLSLLRQFCFSLSESLSLFLFYVPFLPLSRAARTTTIIRDTNRPTCDLSLETYLHVFSFYLTSFRFYLEPLRVPFRLQLRGFLRIFFIHCNLSFIVIYHLSPYDTGRLATRVVFSFIATLPVLISQFFVLSYLSKCT